MDCFAAKPLMVLAAPVDLVTTSILVLGGLLAALGGLLFLLLRLRALLSYLLLRLAHPAAQLLEGGHLVRLVLEVDVVHLLLGQVDELAAVAAGRQHPVAFHRNLGDDALPGRLAPEHVEHAAEPTGELDLPLLLGLDVGVDRGTAADDDTEDGCEGAAGAIDACHRCGSPMVTPVGNRFGIGVAG